MCMLQSGKGGITEKAAAMTMLNNTASIPRRRSHFRDQLDSFCSGLAASSMLFPREQHAFRQWAMVQSSAARTPKKTG
jgi:hypothetical protein